MCYEPLVAMSYGRDCSLLIFMQRYRCFKESNDQFQPSSTPTSQTVAKHVIQPQREDLATNIVTLCVKARVKRSTVSPQSAGKSDLVENDMAHAATLSLPPSEGKI